MRSSHIFFSGDICKNKGSKFCDNAHILSHCKFFDRVKMNYSNLIEADESYTTQMCCNCFSLNQIGASKIYSCKNCDLKADRDFNSAINILIKNYSGAELSLEEKSRDLDSLDF